MIIKLAVGLASYDNDEAGLYALSWNLLKVNNKSTKNV